MTPSSKANGNDLYTIYSSNLSQALL